MQLLPRLAYPKVVAPTFQHVAMFRAVSASLRSDPTFPTVCKTFVDWSGTAADTWDPAFSLCPYCRITPGSGRSNNVTERQHTAPLVITVDVATQGTDYDDLGNFWGLIFNALFVMTNLPQFTTVTANLQAAGVTRAYMALQGIFPVKDNENNFMLIGNGQLVFNSLLPH